MVYKCVSEDRPVGPCYRQYISQLDEFLQQGKNEPTGQLNYVSHNNPSTKPLMCELNENRCEKLFRKHLLDIPPDAGKTASQLVRQNTFDELSDVCVTYLGQVCKKSPTEAQAQITLPVDNYGFVTAYTFTNRPLRLLWDSGATGTYLSKSYFESDRYLQDLPRYKSRTRAIRVGNGQTIDVMFGIQLPFRVHDHLFEVFCLVAEMPTLDLVLGITSWAALEASLSTKDWTISFKNKSPWLLATETVIISPGQKRIVKCRVKYHEEISGYAIVKAFGETAIDTLKVKFKRNIGFVLFHNTTDNDFLIDKSIPTGIVDIRSLGYHKLPGSQPGTAHLDQLVSDTSKIDIPAMLSLGTGSYTFMRNVGGPDQSSRIGEAMSIESRVEKFMNPTNDPLYMQIINDMPHFKRDKVLSELKEKTTLAFQKTSGKENMPYPWLDPSDPRKHMTDREILEKYIDLSNAELTAKEKKAFMNVLVKHKNAFSLRDEIGQSPDYKIQIDLLDETHFTVHPGGVPDENKPLLDKHMHRLVNLGILEVEHTAGISPVMMIKRKVTEDKRPVVDFRWLNTKIKKRNIIPPSFRDVLSQIGKNECELFSTVDIKDAFHSIPLTGKSQDYCGILPYIGSPTFKYLVMPMGLSISPAVWTNYVNYIISCMPEKEPYIAIMDDILVHTKKRAHWKYVLLLLKTMTKHGLKLSPKKCKFFQKKIDYFGNVLSITEKGITITPIKSRIKALIEMPPPKTVTEIKSFAGVVNFLSVFCKDLQLLLSPLYQLCKKGVPFRWMKPQHDAFNEIKRRLTSPPVLYAPTPTGRYTLYSDTSRTHAGSALWQNQKGENRLIGFASKTLPKAALNYSVTELEMLGLCINILLWLHFIAYCYFDCVVDHLAIVQIMKSKNQPATKRIARFIEVLGRFCFNLYYIKGKDVILSDFLSRIKVCTEDPHEVVPISFQMDPESKYSWTCPSTPVLQEKVMNVLIKKLMKFKEPSKNSPSSLKGALGDYIQSLNIATRASTKQAGLKVPEVHGANKSLDPHSKPESQSLYKPTSRASPTATKMVAKKLLDRSIKYLQNKSQKTKSDIPPSMEVISRKLPTEQNPLDLISDAVPQAPKITVTAQPTPDKIQAAPPNTAKLTEPVTRTNKISTRPKHITPQDVLKVELYKSPHCPQIDLNQPEMEEEFSPTFRVPTQTDLLRPPSITDVINKEKVNRATLPYQIDIDKVMKQIKTKILRNLHLPILYRDMQAAYQQSPHFKGIYEYLSMVKTPKNKVAAAGILGSSRYYMLVDILLFQVGITKNGSYFALLCIPVSKINMVLDQYHSSLFGGHHGIIKTYITLAKRFYCPNLGNHVRAYITGCHLCQTFKHAKKFKRPLQKRINLNTFGMNKISMDIKYMNKSSEGFQYILVIISELSNYMAAYPLKTQTSAEVCLAIYNYFLPAFGKPEVIICDQGAAFVSEGSRAFFHALGVSLITVSTTNHQSLQAEHGIKSLVQLLEKHLTKDGSRWHMFLPAAVFNYNTYNSPNLDQYSPYELTFGHPPKIHPGIEIVPKVPRTGTYAQYYTELRERLMRLRTSLNKFRDDRLEAINKDREYQSYVAGQFVYAFNPEGSHLQTNTRKIQAQFVGPLVVYMPVSPDQFLLMTLDGYVYPHLIEISRLKPGAVMTEGGPVYTLAQLRDYIRGSLVSSTIAGGSQRLVGPEPPSIC